ncbi:MAG: hypothetical protein A3C79_00980 [Candidatus Taylorbacteria bacterium RIFCSPHIGHO2_02_FULL_45_28]|uniref:Uncharacterized protein n=1 Tax=Candidatus Taylorbacteria bacterium RIFCSPHIGHO2_12_FULL_45_16 TaxID=1802315 RepID=A0A1G2MZI6_9BACT|nr:MAG: hypothetical protein A2830_02230 [Candidatus Taylorbacteria bacterium RIFCSPHIGHO2_01_FULL_44_110]OHA25594.1 MAG: hypothetical protein A3C79_00980 [Candidatus Taylorbacteria bacterium RIFCSPHIGHO2_02_FULL_45_28]OHA29260.1 MAG: hypothetical protein A3F51_01445 [Candidatus Taylorbacteria bacterium RIFCSPHIGHO2_12_FULL_45_16]OHA33482.1 MAG: hypothetical protein A3A23_02325 [Candidatus Taylorbacteria bacterium RIFCSPLOWO2_01_FULL_45_59]OHA39188.1 MAG: hypothetical protein A3I98_01965 [Candi
MLKKYSNVSKGVTFVEVIIFTVLLSMLVANMINYIYAIHARDLKLMDEIQNAEKGFIATTAVMLLAMGALFFQVATLSAVASYFDGIERKEMRVQKRLNETACQETLRLLAAKDYFLNETVKLRDLGCVVAI